MVDLTFLTAVLATAADDIAVAGAAIAGLVVTGLVIGKVMGVIRLAGDQPRRGGDDSKIYLRGYSRHR